MRSLEWASGLFEGGGCFSLHKGYVTKKDGHTHMALDMNLQMTDEDVVRAFHEAVGVGTVAEMNTPTMRAKGRKPAWVWRTKGAEAEILAWKLLPHLGLRRRMKFLEIIQTVNDNR